MTDPNQPRPQGILSVFDAITIMVGLVLGVGIFRTPSIVAGSVESEAMFVLVWIVGGIITFIGALCYAELSAAHPNAGGEYHFLSRAYGRSTAMMFGWARCTVIQTGAIAAVAFMLGDYVAQLVPAGPLGPAIYAALAVIVLTAVNVIGTIEGKNLQVVVTFLEIGAIGAIILFGMFGSPETAERAAPSMPPETAAIGMAMIFVLLTYGGWNEAAYLTGELKDAPRNIAKVLAGGTVILVVLYTLANLALLSVLGLDGLRQSDAVAADMMRVVAGPIGERVVTAAIVVAAISTLNATIFTGSRVFYAMARDMTVMQWVGVWDGRGKTPANGQIAQGIIALALIAVGAITRDGFKAMVDYTAPVFWGFLLLVGCSLFVLRWRHPERALPYRVPLYPVTPIIFCLTCLYMLYASVAYTGAAALIGLAMLAAGAPILLFKRKEVDAAEQQDASPDPM
ncbi:APC family permease [Cupriavidus gilardii]|uniref:Amino acid permease n=1 Tax=Cupriavidus gilardii TaxID=82541 RepID=A0A849B922_9BURK|nr:amino acid permease [Cupriavidus gilardii]KAB0597584.1 amino acid permease [Cupriavidus gilardii]MCT9014577.1 amino acid permease [Cupriavidus gilardii]MCT9054297.1 amino acid permease [Cupriavidus gilardii]NNH12230.1 amino acid permease [Cupriavidus gilardii]WNG68297.1 amino acid permease [Cupriavidus gilardii]